MMDFARTGRLATRISILAVASLILCGASGPVSADTILVNGPGESIQVAIDAAADGDTVLIAPGTYNESLRIANKSITLASQFLLTADPAVIDQTIISGAGLGAGGARAARVLRIAATAGTGTRIVGLTFQDGSDGILPFAPAEYDHIRITQTSDGIDFESGSGGWVHDCVFEGNSDDGLDLDRDVDIVIERNTIRNNGDDGIEIRLHDLPGYTGPLLEIEIRDNVISGNGEDGIQLIDDTTLTPRVFTIERNIIADNAFAGLGMMCCQDTIEDFQGASIPERVLLANNTFSGNDHGVTGGDNLIALNNLFVDSTNIGLKNADGASIAAHNLFFGNGIDHQASNVDLPTTVFADPVIDPAFVPGPGSAAIDAGTAFFQIGAEVVLDRAPSSYNGAAPDIGAKEALPNVPATSALLSLLLVMLLVSLVVTLLRGRTSAAPGTG